MQTYYTQLASVVQFFWLNLLSQIQPEKYTVTLAVSCSVLLCVPLLLLWVFCAVVTDSPKTKTLLGKTEAAVTRLCNKPNIQKFRFRSLRGHVFPFCLFSFFLVSPGRSEGSSGLTSLWRHIASRPKPLVVVLFLSPFQITQNKAELLYIIAALHITLHCFFTIDFFVSLFLLQFLSAHETWQQLCYSQCLFKYLQVQLVSVCL